LGSRGPGTPRCHQLQHVCPSCCEYTSMALLLCCYRRLLVTASITGNPIMSSNRAFEALLLNSSPSS
jgi:hypothetical protein